MGRHNRPRSYPQRPKSGRWLHTEHYRPNVKVVVCSTGKPGFTHTVAEMKLAEYANQVNSRRNKPQRIYKCPDCGAWHLTSQPRGGTAQ